MCVCVCVGWSSSFICMWELLSTFLQEINFTDLISNVHNVIISVIRISNSFFLFSFSFSFSHMLNWMCRAKSTRERVGKCNEFNGIELFYALKYLIRFCHPERVLCVYGLNSWQRFGDEIFSYFFLWQFYPVENLYSVSILIQMQILLLSFFSSIHSGMLK